MVLSNLPNEREYALNGDGDYDGGRLTFATDGGLQVPSRPAGSAIPTTTKSSTESPRSKAAFDTGSSSSSNTPNQFALLVRQEADQAA